MEISKRNNHEMENWTKKEVHGPDELLTNGQKILFNYFQNKAPNKKIFQRADFDPKDLPKLLPGIALFDIIEDQTGNCIDAKTRLLGTGVANFYGEHTNSLLSEYANKKAAERVLSAIKQNQKSEKPVLCYGVSAVEEKSFFEIHGIFYPLANDQMKITQSICLFEIKTKKVNS